MRVTLVSWLVEVSINFNLLPETLFISVNLIDRYSDCRPVGLSDYQLLGITSMLIAAKYEEIMPPSVNEFVNITDNSYNRDQILAFENRILSVLEFEVTVPTTFRFIERFASMLAWNQQSFHLSAYLGELTMLESNMNRWYPSRIACSCIYLAQRMLKKSEDAWP